MYFRRQKNARPMENCTETTPHTSLSLSRSYPRPPQASTLKNAGLAYLNLVKYVPQGRENDKKDVLLTPYDPLGAAFLLPWKIEGVTPLHRQCNSCFSDDCIATRGDAAEGQVNGRGEGKRTRRTTGRGVAATTRGSSLGPSKAVGNWRNEASVRFMQVWKEFLDHEDAALDSQYDAVRDIYGQVADRLGANRQRVAGD